MTPGEAKVWQIAGGFLAENRSLPISRIVGSGGVKFHLVAYDNLVVSLLTCAIPMAVDLDEKVVSQRCSVRAVFLISVFFLYSSRYSVEKVDREAEYRLPDLIIRV